MNEIKLFTTVSSYLLFFQDYGIIFINHQGSINTYFLQFFPFPRFLYFCFPDDHVARSRLAGSSVTPSVTQGLQQNKILPEILKLHETSALVIHESSGFVHLVNYIITDFFLSFVHMLDLDNQLAFK